MRRISRLCFFPQLNFLFISDSIVCWVPRPSPSQNRLSPCDSSEHSFVVLGASCSPGRLQGGGGGEELGILSLSLWRHCDYMTGPCGLHHPVLGDARDEMQGFWYTRGFLPTEQCLQQTRFIWKTNKERLTKQKVGKAAQWVGLLN